jgi:ribosomal protein L44E
MICHQCHKQIRAEQKTNQLRNVNAIRWGQRNIAIQERKIGDRKRKIVSSFHKPVRRIYIQKLICLNPKIDMTRF